MYVRKFLTVENILLSENKLGTQDHDSAGLEIHGGKVVNYHQNPQIYHQLLKLVVNFYHHILPRMYHSVSPP